MQAETPPCLAARVGSLRWPAGDHWPSGAPPHTACPPPLLVCAPPAPRAKGVGGVVPPQARPLQLLMHASDLARTHALPASAPPSMRLLSPPRALLHAMADFFAPCAAAPAVYKFYKEGEWCASSSGKTVKIVNPATNTSVFEVQGEGGRGRQCGPGSPPTTKGSRGARSGEAWGRGAPALWCKRACRRACRGDRGGMARGCRRREGTLREPAGIPPLPLPACTQAEVDGVFEAAKKAQKVGGRRAWVVGRRVGRGGRRHHVRAPQALAAPRPPHAPVGARRRCTCCTHASAAPQPPPPGRWAAGSCPFVSHLLPLADPLPPPPPPPPLLRSRLALAAGLGQDPALAPCRVHAQGCGGDAGECAAHCRRAGQGGGQARCRCLHRGHPQRRPAVIHRRGGAALLWGGARSGVGPGRGGAGAGVWRASCLSCSCSTTSSRARKLSTPACSPPHCPPTNPPSPTHPPTHPPPRPPTHPLQGQLLTSDSFPGQDRTKVCLASKVPLGVVLAIPVRGWQHEGGSGGWWWQWRGRCHARGSCFCEHALPTPSQLLLLLLLLLLCLTPAPRALCSLTPSLLRFLLLRAHSPSTTQSTWQSPRLAPRSWLATRWCSSPPPRGRSRAC